jgi:hypothetical protein
MWSKKWYFKRNISCAAHLLNEFLEMDVPWDDAIVESAGKLRKLCDSLSELRSSSCGRRLERTAEACAVGCQNCAVCSVFPSGMTSHSKIAQFNWECIGRCAEDCGWCECNFCSCLINRQFEHTGFSTNDSLFGR